MQRIRKLLALAQSSNPFEAEAAMLKAHRLMRKYQVERVGERKRAEYISVFLGRPAVRHTRDIHHMAGLLQEFYFVRCIWISAYVLERGKMGRVPEISGSPKTVRLASYAYDCIRRYIASCWENFNSHRSLTSHRRTDFAVGIIEGFRRKLLSHQRSHLPGRRSHALIPLRDPALDRYVRERYPQTRSRRIRGGADADVYSAGLSAGKRLIIAHGIERNSTANRGFLQNAGEPKE
jgi:hypothetical protein